MDFSNELEFTFLDKKNLYGRKYPPRIMQIVEFTIDIIAQINQSLTNDRLLSRLAFETFQKIDIDSTGTIPLGHIIDQFGHADKRKDTELEKEFKSLVPEENADFSSIDKTEFKKQFTKALEILKRTLIKSTYEIVYPYENNLSILERVKSEQRSVEIIQEMNNTLGSFGVLISERGCDTLVTEEDDDQ